MQLTLSKYSKILRIRSGANCKSDEAAPRLTTLSGLRLCWCVCVCAHNVSLIDTFRKATALTNWMSLGQLDKLPGTGSGGRTQAISLSLLNSLIQVGAIKGKREGRREEGARGTR